MPGHIYTHLSPNGASHPGLDFGQSFVFGSFVISIFSMLSVALSQTLFSYGKRPRLGVYFPNFSQTPFPGGTRGFAVLTFSRRPAVFFCSFCVLTVYPRLSFTTGYVDSGTLWISLRRSNNLRADRQINSDTVPCGLARSFFCHRWKTLQGLSYWSFLVTHVAVLPYGLG